MILLKKQILLMIVLCWSFFVPWVVAAEIAPLTESIAAVSKPTPSNLPPALMPSATAPKMLRTEPTKKASPSSDIAEIPASSPSSAPWNKPRELSSFQSLLQHSPFSLATAEDSSPLSERYMITGVITLDGEEQIFVMDRNDQSRELVTKKPNSHAMSLVTITHDDDPTKLKATIRVNGETGVITNVDLAENNSKIGKPGSPASIPNYSRGNPRPLPSSRYPSGGYPASGYPAAGYPPSGGYPGTGYPGRPSSSRPPSSITAPYPNDHRVIRRPSITSPSGISNSYQPGMPSNYQPRTPNNYQPGMPNVY